MNLTRLDTYTMASLLGFGNLLLLTLLLAYRRHRPRHVAFDYFMLARLLQGMGWIFISARGTWPDLITVAPANMSLLFGVAAESIAFLSYRERSQSRERYFVSCAVVGSVIFLVFARTPPLIVAVGALAALSMEIPTAFMLLKRTRESSLVGFMGVLFTVISATFVVRMVSGFQGVLDYTVRQAALQSSFYLPVFTVLLAGSPAMVLLLKQEDERALGESNEKYNALFRYTPSAVFLSEPDSGIILDANPQCLELTGYAPEEVCGKNFTDLGLWQPGEREKAEAAYREKGRIVAHEIAARNRAGENCTWLVSSGLVQLRDKVLLASSISDISTRKALETRIQGLLTEKELLLHEVHHRVRNNLNQIVG
ncbi:MAG: PAS domain S-box protein, partial [Spirochaetaceae bacterium]